MKKVIGCLLVFASLVTACALQKSAPPREAPRPRPTPPPAVVAPKPAPVTFCDCQWWARYNNTSPCKSGSPLCFKFIAWRDVNACERDLGFCAAGRPSQE